MGELHQASFGLSIVGMVFLAAAALTSAGTLVLASNGGGTMPRWTYPVRPDWLRAATDAGTWAALGFLGGALIARTVEAQRPPYANLWEYFLAFSFAILLAHVFVERIWGRTSIGVVVLPLTFGMLLLGNVSFSAELEPLVPALNNNQLLAIHVAAMIVSYGFLAVAFAAAAAYLVVRRMGRIPWLPSAETAERVTHHAILVGFPILGLGIVLGAYWGNIAWGRYWGWDPKETTALISWLVYAGYMHARSLRGWRGERAALLAVAGFGVIIFNIFAVNFLISGLHSYA